MIKNIRKVILFLLLAALISAIVLVAAVLITEYRPTPVSPAETPGENNSAVRTLSSDRPVTVLSWNTGYGGLDQDADFFMDGGTMVNPVSQKHVQDNIQYIADMIISEGCDITFLQETDQKSQRTKNLNEPAFYQQQTGLSLVYAPNYRCLFVPYPFPPIGPVDSGLATLTDLASSGSAERISLPCPFTWPVSAANLKRCLLVSRYPVEGTGKELVSVNLHLEAYDDGEGKIQQTKVLLELLESEYEKGNYVIAGGDFNQCFPNSDTLYPIQDPSLWTPGVLNKTDFSDGWQLAWDTDSPTCRSLDKPYDSESRDTHQFYIIDGFIVSPNLKIDAVETLDLDFAHSDHNPVKLTASFL